ncbi:MAG TPA: hypothetical protein EYP35_06105 [Desulfobacterales bacterium]|nr:hypothetical protein [Desulfobacterales bacterium]
MNQETEDITVTANQEQYKRIEALATLRRISVEKLVDEIIESHMASVNIALGELSRNIFIK